MTTYNLNDYISYPVRYSVEEETGFHLAYFRDFDGMTQAKDADSIKNMALDWLVLSGVACPRAHKIIPPASAPQEGEEVIAISPTIALKFILRNAMTSKNLRPADLARLLETTSQAVNALLDVYREGTRFDALYKALKVCGAEVSVSAS